MDVARQPPALLLLRLDDVRDHLSPRETGAADVLEAVPHFVDVGRVPLEERGDLGDMRIPDFAEPAAQLLELLQLALE